MPIPFAKNIISSAQSRQTNLQKHFDNWEKIIVGANENYKNKQLFAAIGAYQQAISISKTMVDLSPSNSRALSSLLVSYHNLSDVYLYQHTNEENQTALELAFSLIEEVESLIDSVSQRFYQQPDIIRFVSIARQHRLLFLKKYPHFSAQPCARHEHAIKKSSH